MSSENSESRSLLLRSGHILLIQLLAVRAGQPEPADSPALERVPLTLSVRLQQVLKGTTKQAPGSELQVPVSQYRRKISRIFAVPGVWSEQRLQVGAQLLAFSRNGSEDAIAQLQDPCVEQVLPAEHNLSDVTRALKAESAHLPAMQLAKDANAVAGQIGHLFAEYLADRTVDASVADPFLMHQLAVLIAAPPLAPDARSVLLSELASTVADSDSVSKDQRAELAALLFHLLRMKEAEELHPTIIESDLPGVLGLDDEQPHLTSAEFFQRYPGERDRVQSLLKAYAGEGSTAELLKWVHGK